MAGQVVYPYFTGSSPRLLPTQPSVQWVSGSLPRCQGAEAKADLSRTYSPGVKNKWSVLRNAESPTEEYYFEIYLIYITYIWWVKLMV
jgi:hypothetical protein